MLNWCLFHDKVLVKTEKVLNSAEANESILRVIRHLNLAISSIIKHSNLKITELMLAELESVLSTSKKVIYEKRSSSVMKQLFLGKNVECIHEAIVCLGNTIRFELWTFYSLIGFNSVLYLK